MGVPKPLQTFQTAFLCWLFRWLIWGSDGMGQCRKLLTIIEKASCCLAVGHCLGQGFYCRDETPWPKAVWRSKSLFWFTTLQSHPIAEGRQGKNSRQGAGTEAKALEELLLPGLLTQGLQRGYATTENKFRWKQKWAWRNQCCSKRDFLSFFLPVLETEPRTCCMWSKCSVSEP